MRGEYSSAGLSRWMPVVIALAIVLAYANSFHGVFLFDDLSDLRDFRSAHELSSVVLKHGRPLLGLSFWLNHAVGGKEEAGYHLVNLLVHVGAALLLFGVVRRVLQQVGYGSQSGNGNPNRILWVAAMVAGIWGVHPLTTGSVTYISQRAESLMALFYLLVLYGFIRGMMAGRRRWFAVAVSACLLGAGTKEVIVTAPIAVWLCDVVIFRTPVIETWRRRKLLYGGLFLSWIGLAVLMAVMARFRPNESYDWQDVSRLSYLLTQSQVILAYLKLTIWPWPQCLDWQWPLATSLAQVWPQVLFIGLLLAITLAGLLAKVAWAYPAAMFFLILAPTSSVVPRPDPMFEHRAYLALAGVAVLVVLALDRAVCRRARGWILIGLGVTLIADLGVATHVRNRLYYSEVAMWADVVRQRPDNLRARNDLASSLAAEGRIEAAMVQFESVLERVPEEIHDVALAGDPASRGVVRTNGPRYQYFTAQANLGLMLYKEMNDPRAAARHYVLALRALPWRRDVRAKLDVVLEDMGVSLEEYLKSELKDGTSGE